MATAAPPFKQVSMSLPAWGGVFGGGCRDLYLQASSGSGRFRPLTAAVINEFFA